METVQALGELVLQFSKTARTDLEIYCLLRKPMLYKKLTGFVSPYIDGSWSQV